jgi:hypothetical protein
MLEAEQSYLPKDPSTITRRQLLAAALVVVFPKPAIGSPIPPTCQPCPVRGRPFAYEE